MVKSTALAHNLNRRMPELPEVETTRRGVADGLTGRMLSGAIVRHSQLRWPVPDNLAQLVAGRTVREVGRRAKYLLLDLGDGTLIIHLGMSGSLRLVAAERAVEKHDHIDLLIAGTDGPRALRFRDPRRFGALLWAPPGELHPLLRALGPEPLDEHFTPAYLQAALARRGTAIKPTLMDNHVVVGVGNIYANESLFRSGISPEQAANTLTLAQCARLVMHVRETLTEAIAAGGSTLRDFVDSDGKSGYFQQRYFVYGRTGQPCYRCGTLIRQIRQAQRSTCWCPHCQER